MLVKAADHIARQAGIGQSGSFEAPAPIREIAETIGVPAKTLQQIHDDLPQEVKRRSEALGLEIPRATAKYCDLIQTAAADLAQRHTKLSTEGRSLQTASGYLAFAQEFLHEQSSSVAAIDMAEDFARRWQRFFQTGTVCLCLTAGPREGALDTAIVEALGHSHKTVLEAPADESPIPKPLAGRFTMLDAHDRIDWLLDQVDVDFNRGQTKLLPLLSDGQAIGLIAFELNYPADAGLFAEKFEMAASLAGTILGLALAKERQEHLAERLSHDNGSLETARPRTPDWSRIPSRSWPRWPPGVAHELNNPLSVITGRAQLIAQSETDGQKRNALEKIVENAREASSLVDDLMAYAEPPQPQGEPGGHPPDHRRGDRPGRPQDRRRTYQHAGPRGAGGCRCPGGLRPDRLGPGEHHRQRGRVLRRRDGPRQDHGRAEPASEDLAAPAGGLTLQISDLGCGMDEATRKKAASPFFSAKPAGRKRGMGLAFASRLIQLNGGVLEIESQSGHGTTVTVTLPTE